MKCVKLEAVPPEIVENRFDNAKHEKKRRSTNETAKNIFESAKYENYT
jgi:hypothetical protein